MMSWLAWLYWIDVKDTGVWLYQENFITGRRRAIRTGTGYQPLDGDWLERLPTVPAIPPVGGSSTMQREKMDLIA